MKRHSALLAAVLAPVLLTGCNKPMDLGTWSGSTYSNNFFNFVISTPPGWKPASRETIRKLSRLGAKFVGAKDTDLAKALDRGDISSYQLFMFSEHEYMAPVDFNTNMVCSMDRVSHVRSIRSAGDFQKRLIGMLSRIGVKVDPSATGPVTLGSNTFHRMKGVLSVQGMEVKQEYFSILKNGYALSFILSYADEGESYDDLKQSLSSMTFTR